MSTQVPYAGDLSPAEAWKKLQEDPKAVLIDVRTQPEWLFVGTPDLSGLDKKALTVSWQVFPSMGRNPGFAEQVAAQGVSKDNVLLFLCRSGARSRAAAEFMTTQGYTAFNVSEGFEGDLDADKHRGRTGGWKARALPWTQG